MVRKLARCTVARAHREKQYLDRVTYWHSRNISRTFSGCSSPATIVLICDGMDAAKFCWPKDDALKAKEYNRFIPPKLTTTACIVHGHDILVGISLPGVAADSSRTIDIIARALERCRERGQNLCGAEILLQGDNGPKEIKNNGVVRYLSMLVADKKIRRAEVRTLMTGHTHEDVHSLFANFASILKCGGHRLHAPWDYIRVIQDYLNRGDVRPSEPTSEVALVDQVRDWCPGFMESGLVSSPKRESVYGNVVLCNAWFWLLCYAGGA